jgi:hypothetical protein
MTAPATGFPVVSTTRINATGCLGANRIARTSKIKTQMAAVSKVHRSKRVFMAAYLNPKGR